MVIIWPVEAKTTWCIYGICATPGMYPAARFKPYAAILAGSDVWRLALMDGCWPAGVGIIPCRCGIFAMLKAPILSPRSPYVGTPAGWALLPLVWTGASWLLEV